MMFVLSWQKRRNHMTSEACDSINSASDRADYCFLFIASFFSSGFLLCLNKTAFHTVACICGSRVPCVGPSSLNIMKPDRPRQIHYIHHHITAMMNPYGVCWKYAFEGCWIFVSPLQIVTQSGVSPCHMNESFNSPLWRFWRQAPRQEFSLCLKVPERLWQ